MKIHAATVLASLAFATAAPGASTFVPGAPVDWLSLGPGGTGLLNDGGAIGATLNVTLNGGALLPTTPAASTLADVFWSTNPPAVDSIFGNSALTAVEIRVLPFNGLADYEVEVVLPIAAEFVLAVGQFFADGQDATDRVEVQSGAATPIQYLGSFGWDDGLKPFDQGLVWDGGTNQLSPVAGANGDSQMAFFLVTDSDRVTISLPSAYALGSGDSVLFAVGIVPEPSLVALLLGAAPLLLLRRRRPS